MPSENIIIAAIAALPPTLVAVFGVIIQLRQIHKHKNHEATSDDTNSQISILLNGGLEARIKEAIKEQLKP